MNKMLFQTFGHLDLETRGTSYKAPRQRPAPPPRQNVENRHSTPNRLFNRLCPTEQTGSVYNETRSHLTFLLSGLIVCICLPHILCTYYSYSYLSYLFTVIIFSKIQLRRLLHSYSLKFHPFIHLAKLSISRRVEEFSGYPLSPIVIRSSFSPHGVM